MNQSENLAFSMTPESIRFYAKIQGQGAAAPIRAPTTFSSTSFISFMHASNNFISLVATDITRSGAGVYTAKLRDFLPVIVAMDIQVAGTNGKWGSIVDYNPTTGVISFLTFSSAGAATDLATTDFAVFVIDGQKVKPTY
jgi:hypothetical protein